MIIIKHYCFAGKYELHDKIFKIECKHKTVHTATKQ